MPTYDQLPACLNLRWSVGDDVSVLLDFDIALTSYTATAAIYSTVTGATVATFATAIADAAAGKINISLTDTQTTTLGPGTFRWALVWTLGAVSRTSMEGYVDAIV
jgi:hypothetical protein